MGETAAPGSTSTPSPRLRRVSRQTVTNVLRHPERVAPRDPERVQAEIVRLGYRPSAAAQSLQAQRAGAIGVELNALGADSTTRDGAVRRADAGLAAPSHAFHIVPFGSPSHTPTLEGYQQLWRSRLVDAFVIADTHHGDPRPAWLRDQGIPFASFGRVWDDPAFTRWVDVDGRRHGTGRRPLRRGRLRTIGYLGWPEGRSSADDRGRAGPTACARPAVGRTGRTGPPPDDLERRRPRPPTRSSPPSAPAAPSCARPTCWRSACSTPCGGPGSGPVPTSGSSASTTRRWPDARADERRPAARPDRRRVPCALVSRVARPRPDGARASTACCSQPDARHRATSTERTQEPRP